MAIIISKSGVGAVRVEESGVPKEGYLETYVAANPESLPLSDIKENVRLSVLTRQFPTRSGPIDVLAVDGDGDLYIIETKLFRNPDKRLVVAQVLDYGASLWRSYSDGEVFLTELDELLASDQQGGLNGRLRQTFGLNDEGITTVRESMRQNLRDGNLRFVVLMDALHERLKDLILYLNERSRFSIYAVEMQFYRHEGYEIVIPKLFGAEASKAATPRGGRGTWDEHSFFEEAKKLPNDQFAAVEKLYQFAQRSGAEIGWGTGRVRGSFNPRYLKVAGKSLFTVSSNGTLDLNFKWLNRSDAEIAFRDRYIACIRQSGITPLPPGCESRFVPVDNWHSRVDEFIRALKQSLEPEVDDIGRLVEAERLADSRE